MRVPAIGIRALFEIVPVTHGDDDAAGRHHHPAAILALDGLHRAEARQRRAEHGLE